MEMGVVPLQWVRLCSAHVPFKEVMEWNKSRLDQVRDIVTRNPRKEVREMWIVVGRILCKIAKVTGHRQLYTATRHSLRSGRPGLFLQYWHYFGRE